ncbi:zinc finger BED domain-containing protein RICESLEEPER 2-like [Populus alba x Populus x berolinensis]|nr:zinc finger BED domain-containing protein RICESLEEPER 2-like [Populus alba x Populus x berolinensis]
MCLTAHWIDEGWNLNKRILNFYQVSNHKGETIGQAIESCLLEWGIDNILTVTVDNASSNNLTIKYLKRVTSNWTTNILSNDFIHVRCCAHIVNLIACAGLKDIDDSVVKIRNAVRLVRSSPSRQLVFNQCAERLKIGSKKSVCLDVATRWNSIYMMLDATAKFDVVFMRLEETNPRYLSYFEVNSKGKQKTLGPPALEDWEKARFFVKFLKLFYTITLKFSGSLYVTSNSFFHELISMHTSISQLCRSEDVYVSKMTKNMMVKYKKYWGDQDTQNFLLYVAVVLDPHFKLKYMRFCFGRLYDIEEADNFTIKVKDTLLRLFEHYINVDENDEVVHSVVTSINENVNVDLMAVNDDMLDDLASEFKKHLEEERGAQKKMRLRGI